MVERREIDLLLSGGTVVTIDAGRIVAVGTADELGQQFIGRETIDCRDMVVLPVLLAPPTLPSGCQQS